MCEIIVLYYVCSYMFVVYLPNIDRLDTVVHLISSVRQTQRFDHPLVVAAPICRTIKKYLTVFELFLIRVARHI